MLIKYRGLLIEYLTPFITLSISKESSILAIRSSIDYTTSILLYLIA